MIAATTLAFFAMVGLRGLGQHGRGVQGPDRAIFPKVLLAGLVITGTIYVLVSISAITLVRPTQLGEGETPLLKVVQAGAPKFPVAIFGFITMFAVANSALINMLMASRLIYGMGRERVLPARARRGSSDAPDALCGDRLHDAAGLRPDHVRRRRFRRWAAPPRSCCCACSPWSTSPCWCCASDTVEHKHFRTPTILPILGAVCCAFLAGPWTGRDPVQYRIAGILLGIGVVLWVVTVLINRAIGLKPGELKMGEGEMRGPVN